jgi:hypothetical protein
MFDYLKNNSFYLIIVFIVYGILHNYLNFFLISFGDVFYYFHQSLDLQKFLSLWVNYDFGNLNNRNNFSIIFHFAVQKILGIDSLIFWKLVTTTYFIYSIFSLCLLSDIILKKLDVSSIKNLSILKIFLVFFYYTSPLLLQYLTVPDFVFINGIFLMPCLYLVYCNFIKEINLFSTLHLFFIAILFFPVFNNFIVVISIFLGLVPFFLVNFKNSKKYYLTNGLFIFFIFFLFLPNLYVSISSFISNFNFDISNYSSNKELVDWFMWQSQSSTILNIFLGTNYVGWADPSAELVWNFFDLFKYDFIGKSILLLGPFSIVFFISRFNKLEKNIKIILIYILIITFFAKGYNFPFRNLNKIIFENFPIYSAYRSVHILSLSLIFFISIAKVVFINKIIFNNYLNLSVKSLNFLKFFFYISSFYVFTKIFYLTDIYKYKVKIPKEFINVVNFLNDNTRVNRILSYKTNVPVYSWGLLLNGDPLAGNITAEILQQKELRIDFESYNLQLLNKTQSLNKTQLPSDLKIYKFLGIDSILIRQDLTEYYYSFIIPLENNLDFEKNNKIKLIYSNDMYKIFYLGESLITQPNKYVQIN